MPAKRIIILEQIESPRKYRVALWADVPAPRQVFYAATGKVSEWKNASAPENAALASGAVTERVQDYAPKVGETLGQSKTQLEILWTAYQAEITALNRWDRYGTFFADTSTWTNGGVA